MQQNQVGYVWDIESVTAQTINMGTINVDQLCRDASCVVLENGFQLAAGGLYAARFRFTRTLWIVLCCSNVRAMSEHVEARLHPCFKFPSQEQQGQLVLYFCIQACHS